MELVIPRPRPRPRRLSPRPENRNRSASPNASPARRPPTGSYQSRTAGGHRLGHYRLFGGGNARTCSLVNCLNHGGKVLRSHYLGVLPTLHLTISTRSGGSIRSHRRHVHSLSLNRYRNGRPIGSPLTNGCSYCLCQR